MEMRGSLVEFPRPSQPKRLVVFPTCKLDWPCAGIPGYFRLHAMTHADLLQLKRWSMLLGLLLLLAAESALCQSAPSKPPELAPAAEAARRAWSQNQLRRDFADGKPEAAAARLPRLLEAHPDFRRYALEALDLFEKANAPGLGLDLARRLHESAPDDTRVVLACIRIRLLAREGLGVPVEPRPLPAAVPDNLRFIAQAPRFADRSAPVARSALLEDLDLLEIALANAYAYADRRGADWRAALDTLRASLGDSTPIHTFNLRLRRFLTVFGDPHTAVRTELPRDFFPAGRTPFHPVSHGDRVLALKPARDAFLDDDCRYLVAMDGVPVAQWLAAAALEVTKASPQYQWHRTVRGLYELNALRAELGLEVRDEVAVLLHSEDGAREKILTLPLGERIRTYRPGAAGKSRILDGGIGYLPIPEMASDAAFLDGLDDALARLRDTRGLVIDVRGNGGGSQDALRRIMPYLLDADAPMKIVNVAAYRVPVALSRPCREGYLNLDRRSLHPLSASLWSASQREQIEAFLAQFKPEWALPAGRFSDWHVMAISAATNPKAYPYRPPVVVLQDAACFSATDNFLGALQGLPRVTLLGTASGGGSGRMTNLTLPRTGISLSLCQMASFRANGHLYDGRGVAPDIVREAIPSDHLAGGGDAVLAAALDLLRRGAH
jgi:hypothetical protein